MPITPDTKDWTWVLERPCPECRFDAATFGAGDVARMIRENAHEWPRLLDRSDVAERPDDATWSPLEYAAHVRDVYRLFHARLRLMLDEVDPIFENWDQDATALAERYNEQDPATVAGELVAAGERIADEFESLAPEQWSRTGRRTDGAVFTVESFSKYLLHDVVHHVVDVSR
ncbi:DinB family protein [Salinibacterium sp. SYSU T00001]|uniref:DinB family protein n=1 Tax=Homoserinimonas sedimenticola TaxID=2986805 RepID=UPI0022355DC2|nr:DinB family protein [Salinibacterium sedimenticola]MCW4385748.1 DinB family protein [Salinibacterium sedimenticola]